MSTGPAATRAALLTDLRERAFRPTPTATPPRIGVEIEFIPLSAESGRPWPLDGGRPGSSLAFLRRYGRGRGWIEEVAARGSPRFRRADGGTLSFEPGGQVEYSTPACASASALLGHLRATLEPILQAARDEGVVWHATGIDPLNTIDRIPLQIESERYLRMTEYFATLGPEGAKMMRQTAAFHVNLDFGDAPWARFRLLNAAAPYLIAIFAHSPFYAGAPTGHKSYRAHVWRETDPNRTGILAGDGGPAEYLEFCLKAPAILKGPRDGAYRPFAEWVDRGVVTLEDWHAHLLNLYPDIRPRGYLEVRSPDAIPLEWAAAPVALLAGITYHAPSERAAADLLGAPDAERFRRAGRVGLQDAAIAAVARDLVEIALAGCAALGPAFIGGGDLEIARAFFDRYTRRDAAPADDARLLVTS